MPSSIYAERQSQEAPLQFSDWPHMREHIFRVLVDGGRKGRGTWKINKNWKWAKLGAEPIPVGSLPNGVTLWCRLNVTVEDENYKAFAKDLSDDPHAFELAIRRAGRHWENRTLFEVWNMPPGLREQGLARITYGGVVWVFTESATHY